MTELNNIKLKYFEYINSLEFKGGFRLTSNSEINPFSLCFAIFGLNLLKKNLTIEKNKKDWNETLRNNLLIVKKKRQKLDLRKDKYFLQLLTFTLSSLKILGTLESDPLKNLISDLIVKDVRKELDDLNVFEGSPQSGNFAMFMAIILIYSKDYLSLNTNSKINQWLDLHLSKMNKFGFWGDNSTISYLQFQNGYHQYQIFEYLNVESNIWINPSNAVNLLIDNDGHFAPYPGGGGCYDYDAIFFLTNNKNSNFNEEINQTYKELISLQNEDGGFCESKKVHPRNIKNLFFNLKHLLHGPLGVSTYEKLFNLINLSRPKHNRIHTHWTKYSRKWNESDLWDSWFRLLAIARIDCYKNNFQFQNWGFIDFPGIGYHNLFKMDK